MARGRWYLQASGEVTQSPAEGSLLATGARPGYVYAYVAEWHSASLRAREPVTFGQPATSYMARNSPRSVAGEVEEM